MLFKILKNGTKTSADNACEYLMKDREIKTENGMETYTPKVLRGNLDDSRRLANVLQTKNKYTVGVLSFEESDLESKTKDEIMDSFESAIFCDLDRDRYDITWVEHRDKGRLELNFFIPNIELQSAKHLNPYYAPADKRRIANWKTLINEKYNLSSPDDPQNKQAISDKTKHYRPLKPDDPRQKTQGRELREIINKTILELAEKGEIKTRDDVLHQLKLMNLEVKRETKSSISILNPESNKNIRLTGQLYERDLHITSDNLAEMNQKQAIIWREQKNQRQELSKREYETGRQIKAEYYKQKFGENPKLTPNNTPEPEKNKVKLDEKPQKLESTNRLHNPDFRTFAIFINTIPIPRPEPELPKSNKTVRKHDRQSKRANQVINTANDQFEYRKRYFDKYNKETESADYNLEKESNELTTSRIQNDKRLHAINQRLREQQQAIKRHNDRARDRERKRTQALKAKYKHTRTADRLNKNIESRSYEMERTISRTQYIRTALEQAGRKIDSYPERDRRNKNECRRVGELLRESKELAYTNNRTRDRIAEIQGRERTVVAVIGSLKEKVLGYRDASQYKTLDHAKLFIDKLHEKAKVAKPKPPTPAPKPSF